MSVRRTKDPKIAAERLAARLDRVSLDGMTVVLDNHIRFTRQTKWVNVLGIIADLAQRTARMSKAEAWAIAKYQPQLGRAGMIVKDTGWKGQAVRWLASACPDHPVAPLS
jgi:hypothetical protein